MMARRLPQAGGIYVQGEDELASLGIVLGASAAGWKAMTATSGNGICLMQEEIGYAAMTEIPCVIVDAQRAGPGTGIATKSMQGDVYQVRYGSNADYCHHRPGTQLTPGDVQSHHRGLQLRGELPNPGLPPF